jgi:hypothetical protein
MTTLLSTAINYTEKMSKKGRIKGRKKVLRWFQAMKIGSLILKPMWQAVQTKRIPMVMSTVELLS